MTRLVGVELRKMFDTRAGFWLMASVGIVAVLATAAVILWAPDEAIDPGDLLHRDRHAAVGGAADHRDPVGHQ